MSPSPFHNLVSSRLSVLQHFDKSTFVSELSTFTAVSVTSSIFDEHICINSAQPLLDSLIYAICTHVIQHRLTKNRSRKSKFSSSLLKIEQCQPVPRKYKVQEYI